MNSQKPQQCPGCRKFTATTGIRGYCPRCAEIDKWLRTPPQKNTTEKKS